MIYVINPKGIMIIFLIRARKALVGATSQIFSVSRGSVPKIFSVKHYRRQEADAGRAMGGAANGSELNKKLTKRGA